jgi:hypothetical protein
MALAEHSLQVQSVPVELLHQQLHQAVSSRSTTHIHLEMVAIQQLALALAEMETQLTSTPQKVAMEWLSFIGMIHRIPGLLHRMSIICRDLDSDSRAGIQRPMELARITTPAQH